MYIAWWHLGIWDYRTLARPTEAGGRLANPEHASTLKKKTPTRGGQKEHCTTGDMDQTQQKTRQKQLDKQKSEKEKATT